MRFPLICKEHGQCVFLYDVALEPDQCLVRVPAEQPQYCLVHSTWTFNSEGSRMIS